MRALQALGFLQSLRQQPDFKAAQYTVGKLIEGYDNAQTGAEREVFVSWMKRHATMLPPQYQAALAPYIQMGPLSPDKIKSDRFEQIAGKRPEVTVTGDEDPNLYALQLRKQQAWEDSRFEFVTGKKRQRTGTNLFVSGGVQMVSHLREDGTEQVIPVELEQFAGNLKGQNVIGVLNNGGWVDEAVGVQMVQGVPYKEIKRDNILDGRKSLSLVPLGKPGGGAWDSAGSGKGPQQMPANLLNALSGLQSRSRGEDYFANAMAEGDSARLEDTLNIDDPAARAKAIDQFLAEKRLDGWNLIEVDQVAAERGISRLWKGPNKKMFTAVPGRPIQYEYKDGSKVYGYHDTSEGRDHIYSMEGEFLNIGIDEWVEINRQNDANPPQDGRTVTVEEAAKTNPSLIRELIPAYDPTNPRAVSGEGAARQRGLSRGRELPTSGPGSGINRAAEAMRSR